MFIPIELDKPRNLRFDLQACIDMESMLGQSLAETVRRINALSLTAIRGALWAGLKHEDDSLTLTSTHDLMQTFLEGGGKITVLTEALDDALTKSTPMQSLKAGKSVGNAKPKAK